VPFIVEKAFVSRNYTWRALNQRLLIFESLKRYSARVTTKVLSHCSIFEQVHRPALQKFIEFLRNAGHSHHRLYIYDGELIPDPQLQDIVQASPDAEGVLILHHQELAVLIDSKFTLLTE
jgi:hypothetical protein